MISEELNNLVNEVLKAQLADIGFDGAEISEDVDHDGDDILRISIRYRKIGPAIDPSPTFSATTALRHAMRQIGEYRFPHLKHLFPEDQELKVA